MKNLRSALFASLLLLSFSSGGVDAQKGRPDGVGGGAGGGMGRGQESVVSRREQSRNIPDVAHGARERGLERASLVSNGRLRSPEAMAKAQERRSRDLVRDYPRLLELTASGPAVRGEVVALDPDAATLATLVAAGYTIKAEETIAGLDLRSVTLQVPRRSSVDRALTQLALIAPSTTFAANHLHAPSGGATFLTLASAPTLASGGRLGGGAIGLIDGGVAKHPTLRGPIEQRGFATGAPAASAHATAVASLIAGQGPVRGAAPDAPLLVADIYGNDPAGGNALALARALGWMVIRKVPVVAVSLVGPPNPLVARAIVQAQARGLHIVAPVGNGGPAAPPAYPASYASVIAVTGVDSRNRTLIEAGRSLHLDYAAPGADMAAATLTGGLTAVRGTSFAVPFVAGRLFRAIATGSRPLVALDSEAADLGDRGPDKTYGRGLICGDCRTFIRKKGAFRD